MFSDRVKDIFREIRMQSLTSRHCDVQLVLLQQARRVPDVVERWLRVDRLLGEAIALRLVVNGHLAALEQSVHPVQRIDGGRLAAQLRRQDVFGDQLVQRGQIGAVQVNAFASLLLEEWTDNGERRLDVPRLANEMDGLEANWEAVLKEYITHCLTNLKKKTKMCTYLQSLNHQLQRLRVQVRRLAHREIRPVHNGHKSVRLVLLVVQQLFQRQQHSAKYRHQRIRGRIPAGRKKHNHLAAAPIALLHNAGKAVAQRHLYRFVERRHLLQHLDVALLVLVIGDDQLERLVDVEFLGEQKSIQKLLVVATRLVFQRKIDARAN